MKKAKAKAKVVKKSAKKTISAPDESVELSAVRKEIAKIVREGAAKMAQAVVDEAMKGEVAPMKYLFEMTGLHPGAGEQAEVAPPSDSLARLLLKRLGLPEDPVFEVEREVPIRLGETSSAESAGGLQAIAAAVRDGDEVVA